MGPNWAVPALRAVTDATSGCRCAYPAKDPILIPLLCNERFVREANKDQGEFPFVRNIPTVRCRFAATCISTYGLQLRKKMGAYLLLTCIAIPFVAVISLFFIQETRRALDVALGFSLLTFLSSVGL